MRLILGLGNLGEPYRDTRHNVGFRVVEELARRWEIPLDRSECNSLAGLRPGEDAVLLVQPQTYMNRSGAAVRCLAERYELASENLLILYDEVHLPLGRIRLRPAGGPGGHRGMESIVDSLGTDRVPRLRMGVGPIPPGMGEEGLAEFVLGRFLAEESAAVESVLTRSAEAVRTWIESGIELAMNRANLPDPAVEPAADLPKGAAPA